MRLPPLTVPPRRRGARSFTPGFVGDANVASQLAEIGVILLMFGVGLNFSIKDLRAVRTIAIPGAVAQIALATASGVALAPLWDWGFGAGMMLGLALLVASTVVLLRAPEQRSALDTVATPQCHSVAPVGVSFRCR
jgi:CPA2 family monovalent cation:H+ antiporter-2